MEMQTQTPECDKMLATQEESQKLGEFLDWLQSKGYQICVWQEGITDATRIAQAFAIANGSAELIDEEEESPERGFVPINKNIEKLLAEYFNIDLDKVEKEKQAILKELRPLH
jgi:hypothetical protein